MKTKSIAITVVALTSVINSLLGAQTDSKPVVSVPLNLVKDLNERAKADAEQAASIAKVSMDTYEAQLKELVNFEKDTLAAINAAKNENDKTSLRENFWKRQEELVKAILVDVEDSNKRLTDKGSGMLNTIGQIGQLRDMAAKQGNRQEEQSRLRTEIVSLQKDAKLLDEQYRAADRTNSVAAELRKKRTAAVNALRTAVAKDRRLKREQPFQEKIAAQVNRSIDLLSKLQDHADNLAGQYAILADEYRSKLAEIGQLRVLNSVNSVVADLADIASKGRKLSDLTSSVVTLGHADIMIANVTDAALDSNIGGDSIEDLLNYRP